MKILCVILFVGATLLSGGRISQADDGAKQEGLDVAKDKQTILGLYVTAKGAYERWKADPKRVIVLDVRTPEEYVFVGHAAMAKNIPLKFLVHSWDAEKKEAVMKPNPDFVSRVKKLYKPDDEILVTCRSGVRGKAAVNLLAEAGYKRVYNIIDGMEGDIVEDTASVFHGKRLKNGWKNSGLPWTYSLDPKLMYLAPEKKVPEKK